MTKIRIAGLAALMAGLLTSPANALTDAEVPAAASVNASAEDIRSLNIMLMVTSLRCRGGANDFSGEYDLFATAHSQNIADAHQQLVAKMTPVHGEEGSERQLDRLGVQIANRYGEGHPTMDCAELKEATLQLAMSQDRVRLASMATQLLGDTAKAAAPVRQVPLPAQRPVGEGGVPKTQVPNWLRG